MSGSGEDHVNGVTFRAFQVRPAKMSIVFHVADRRLDGVSALEFSFDGGGQAAFLLGDKDIGILCGIMAAVSPINLVPAHGHAGETGSLLQLILQGMPVVGITGTGHGAGDELPARSPGTGRVGNPGLPSLS